MIPIRGASGVIIGDAIEAVCTSKASANYRPAYITSLRQYLTLFARGRESQPLAAFTVDTIEGWYQERGESFNARASNTGRLSALFSFAVRRGWIGSNPCNQLEKVRIDRRPPTIVTPLQAALIIDHARRRKPHRLAFFALAMYAGVRPDELSRIRWDAVNLDDGTVTIDAAASKVRRRRIIYLEPTALLWLKLARECGGKLPVARSTRQRYLYHATRALNLESWPQDLLRHTAASYLLALHRDPGKVANTLGNSARILETNYKALVSAKDCAEFWSFTPDSPRPEKPKVIPEILDPVPLPEAWGVVIDPAWNRFARAQAALAIEPTLRLLGRQRQRLGAYHGGVTGKPMTSDRIDTIREMGRLAGCSRQTMQFVKVIVRHADPELIDKLRSGRLSIAGTYKRLAAEIKTP